MLLDHRVLGVAVLVSSIAGPVTAGSVPAIIPSRFDADRVYVELKTAQGEPLELYTDTGGGALILSPTTAERLHLSLSAPEEMRKELGPNARIAAAPALAAGLPALPPMALVAPLPTMLKGDGFVGARWFADGIWTWDYPARHLVREADGTRLKAGQHVVAVDFKMNADGKRPFGFARISVMVDGKQLPMLFDTGAATQLTPAALAVIADKGPDVRASSMVSATTFEQWHRQHPGWRYIEDGEAGTHASMIEVPALVIAGYRIGPVWFTKRPDANFHDMMSSMMDSRVEGAVGGNVFHHFAITLDYPSARAAFRCQLSCKAVRS